ncbi:MULTISPECIES: uracil-DNA glycosylase [Thiorhodovibrio]|uniref:uracil-DNA glycosylase n=1 Tax=Thiorhodovibrio TaxID=61593 RepID=UPI001914AE7C|nr:MULTISPECIES: uracil-DNA glycosylase [Thiorhodovibrio]MBK5970219.1 SPO1 DNA polymerase [Thiorhodovibrio winogradskyi]WPL12722.1 uracil-DNA glycosylase, family 4 [Thiorhodovibrio litoralis]
MFAPVTFDPSCRTCARLADFLDSVRAEHPDYHAAPVPPFGDPNARLLIVGLAPGMHGANRSGRPFTGDYAGILLYASLHRHGFGSRAESVSADDGLKLRNCRITNAVKCLPPANKPLPAEMHACNRYLGAELAGLPAGAVVLALGQIAHRAVLLGCGLKQSALKFAHGAEHELPGGLRLVDSYHCSRYNTQTRRLTEAMFDQVMARCRMLVDQAGPRASAAAEPEPGPDPDPVTGAGMA